jgi:hypothetical protein
VQNLEDVQVKYSISTAEKKVGDQDSFTRYSSSTPYLTQSNKVWCQIYVTREYGEIVESLSCPRQEFMGRAVWKDRCGVVPRLPRGRESYTLWARLLYGNLRHAPI